MHRRSFIVDSNRVIIHSSFVHAQVREKIAGKLAGLRTASDALRAKHRAQDDERAAAADAAARLLAAKEETAKVRSERREGRRRRADAISSEIATCAVSDRALGELNTRLDQQREAFEDKQRDATSSTVRFFLLIFERAMRMTVLFLIYKQIADDLDAKCRELEELDRKLQRLRSEQDRAAAAGEGALKLRLKREELFAKEERMAALLAAKRPAMRDVFGGDADIPVRLFLNLNLFGRFD